MKIHIILALAFGASLRAGAEGTTNVPTTSTNFLAIYLLADSVPEEQLRNHTATFENVKLGTTPILADADFVTCDVTTDTFVINPVAAIRFGIATAGKRVPYVR